MAIGPGVEIGRPGTVMGTSRHAPGGSATRYTVSGRGPYPRSGSRGPQEVTGLARVFVRTGVGFQDDSVVTDVEFNGTPAAFTVNSDNQLRPTVPAGATTGTISVTDDEATFTTLTDFTITGTNFTGATAVSFNGRPASFTVASESQIAATVPVGASSGPISVTTSGGTGTSLVEFTVTDPGEMHKRGINLQLRRRVARGRVTARDGFAECEAGATVDIQRRGGSGWDTVSTTETDRRGAYRARVRARSGSYRAMVLEATLEGGRDACMDATSALRRVRVKR
jgi:IPT/TIG domain